MALKHHAAPQFFWISKPAGEGAPRQPPRRPAVLRPEHTPAKVRFPSVPCLGFGTIPTDSRLPCQIGASQPRNVVGEGLGWVEHSHPKSPNITERLGADFRHALCLCFTHLAGPVGQNSTSQPREGTRAAKKALPGRFTPNCGETTISVGGSLGLAHDCGGRGVQCGLASDPVPAPDRVEGGHRGWWGGLGCSLMLAFAR